MRIFISAGEVSGDIVAAKLTLEIHRHDPRAEIFGIGGSRTAAAGAAIQYGTNHLGTVGITEAFAVAPALSRELWRIRKQVSVHPPDVAVLIGNDLFNVLLARWLKRRRIRTVAYFPPQVWIWRVVARQIARSFDLILASFAEEQLVYERAGAAVTFVGHYLADALHPRTRSETADARRQLRLPADAPVVSLMPGSRWHEIRLLAPAVFAAAERLLDREPRMHFAVPLADSGYRSGIEDAIRAHSLTGRTVITADSHLAMRASDLVILASGTASIEAALLDVPMVVTYKVSRLSHVLIRCLIRAGVLGSYVTGAPNLLLRRTVVPELLQSRATGEAIANEAWSVLTDVTRQDRMRTAFAELRQMLQGERSIARAATAILELASNRSRSREPASHSEIEQCGRTSLTRATTPARPE